MSSAATAADGEQKPVTGIALGTLEMFSDWYPAAEDVNLDTVCVNVTEGYNQINQERGYRGRMIGARPVRAIYRHGTDGAVERRFFCQLRVFRTQTLESVD